MTRAVPVSMRRAAHEAVLRLITAVLALPAAAQAPPEAMLNLPPDMLQQMEKLSGAGDPLQGGLARINRMTDPDVGKRPGDEKLACAQIKAEFDDTNQKYTAQQTRQDAARQAVETDARKAQAEASGPGAVAGGFFGGLAAIGAHATGAGDAYNEKLRADAIATQSRREALQTQCAQEAEASKAISDRGRTLMSLGQAKGCAAAVPRP